MPESTENNYQVVVIGASAGGLEVLRRLVNRLPADLPAAIFVVQHLYRQTVSLLPASHPYHGQMVEPGHIYVAPPDYHLLLSPPGTILLDHGARENLHRPAIDPLFRSAARTIGVILSGTKDDGAAGMLAIKLRGGRTIVQDPADAPYPEMALSTLDQVEGIDRVAPVAEIAEALVDWARQDVRMAQGKSATARLLGDAYTESSGNANQETPAKGEHAMESDPLSTEPDVLICPECGGALSLTQQGELTQYRCHTGHVFGLKSLDVAYSERVEYALWAAMSALKERAVLNQRLAERTSLPSMRAEYEQQAEAAWNQARQIQELIAHITPQPRPTQGD